MKDLEILNFCVKLIDGMKRQKKGNIQSINLAQKQKKVKNNLMSNASQCSLIIQLEFISKTKIT